MSAKAHTGSLVQALKARYLAACDAKDCDTFRASFADGTVDIDYGALGTFDNADALTAIFRDMACHPHMLEWHHASNPQIEILSEDTAKARWSLHYQLINTQDGTLTQLGGEYDDEYRHVAGAWKITKTHFKPRTTVALKLDEDAVKTLMAGSAT